MSPYTLNFHEHTNFTLVMIEHVPSTFAGWISASEWRESLLKVDDKRYGATELMPKKELMFTTV